MTYFDSSWIRFKVGTEWTEIVLKSEVGVVYTARGYAPALIVDRLGSEQIFLIGAQSLARPIEEIRLRKGSLIGAHIEVHRLRPDDQSPYEIREL